MNVTEPWKPFSFSWRIFSICSLLIINWKSCLELQFYKMRALVKKCRYKGWRPFVLLLPSRLHERCSHSAGKETPAPSDPDLWVIFIELRETVHWVIKISVPAFIIHKTVLHFGKSVPNVLRGISHSRVTADKAECPAAVFCFSWDGSDGMKREREVSTEEGTLHQLCANKTKIFRAILGWLVF